MYGKQGHPALPKDKLHELKMKMLNLHPGFLSCPLDFDPTWTKCVNAINHCAASLRSQKIPTIDLTKPSD